jgi:23S rRNA (pseudouridine1915-N3)-methyltransferase
MRITLIFCGDAGVEYFNTASKEYEKRISAFSEIEMVRIRPEPLDENKNLPQNVIDKALDSEAEKIISAVPKGSYKIALCIEGKKISSEDLSRLVDEKRESGYSSFAFIIGSSFGLSDKIKSMCDFKLSMSPMTFPHQLARVMLLEQIYRAFTISAGKRYHK